LRAWPTLNGRLLTGFSHGAAGIAYALTRLYEITCKDTLLGAAQEAVEYERSVFMADFDNWPDLCYSEPMEVDTSAWCHGATGIGLSRLVSLPGNARGDRNLHSSDKGATYR
jgi:lantibiotic modifying enzyme